MGEIADSMINGEMCQQCGEYLGDEVGYPRYCSGCQPNKRKHKHTRLSRGEQAINGVELFLVKKNLSTKDIDNCLTLYAISEMDSKEVIDRESICNHIQKDFGKFVKWFRKTCK